MQTKIQLPMLLVTVLMTVFACKKDSQPQSKTDVLTTGKWKMSSFVITPAFDIDGDGIIDSDVYATYDPCIKDDYYVFSKNGKMEVNEGPTKCSPYDDQAEIVDWSFVNNETEIIIDGDRCTIKELTSSRFHISLGMSSSSADMVFTR